MEDTEDFGVWLGRQLRRIGMSQAEFGKHLGLTRAAVSAWVTGRAHPRAEVMARIADILQTDVATLVTRDADAGSVRPIGWHHRLAHRDGGREYGNPAAFAFDASLAVLAREATQNSMDERLDPRRPVRVRFTVHELTGEPLNAFLAALKWEELEAHYAVAAESRQKVGRALAEGLRALREDSTLLLLRVDDYNASGLTGPEYGDGRYAAVVRRQLDSHKSSDRAGGSYGLGKAALWAASRLGLVLINSTLSESHEGRTARRVVGRLDLPWREVDGIAYAGPAWLGEPETGKVYEGVSRSWWADERTVADLRLERDSPDPGTSFLVVGAHDAAGDASTLEGMHEALTIALADNFWAAMTSGRSKPAILEASVRALRNGESVIPERRVDPRDRHPAHVHALRTYLDDETVDDLTAPSQVAGVEVPLNVPPPRSAGPTAKGHTHRAVLLVTPGADTDEEHSRIVCMRGTRMTAMTRRPRNPAMGVGPFHAVLLVGCAAGDDEAAHAAEAFLRAAEPPDHGRWGATEELTATYSDALGRLNEFTTAMDVALRAVTGRRAARQESAGLEALRNLMRLDVPAASTRHRVQGYPTVERVVGGVDRAGAWTLDVTLTVPQRIGRWELVPVVKFDVRSGARPALEWAELSAKENCTVVDGRLLVDPDVRSARFGGVTMVDSHPVDAAMASVIVDVQQMREVSA
ncbi:helix-turn-helix domain-containing protein [Streptomyces fradiae]|uniref:helix-turn-helix domain-containing protein n=1 Tax=Streptomyces fradiae TaxID=1906 RepID=UPI002943661D|nr:helix-turn-helix transcriptional regulator [Streptomyces fradiae]WOI59361.1 helix-turn-helix transcriptional regulator [Streptomyces fradiae]